MTPLPRILAGPMRATARLLSPGGRRGALLVLMYHRVLPQPDPLLPDEPDAAAFAAQIDLVGSLCRVIGLSEAVQRLREGSLPPRAAAITFDDGYANNLDVAVPILAGHGMTATFYVATGFIEGGAMFNDIVIEALRAAPAELDLADLGLGIHRLADAAARRAAVDALLSQLKYLPLQERLQRSQAIAARAGLAGPPSPMMDEGELRRLAACGMEIGAHCITHPILTRLEAASARREIRDSRRRLQEITGQPVRSFAYPNGRPGRDYAPEHVAMVREAGYGNAVSTAWGAATGRSDPLQIPRIAPWDRTGLRYALRLLRAWTQGGG